MKASSVGRGPVSSRATSAAALARAMGAAEARTAPVARIRGEAGVLAAAETPGGAETVVDARDRGPGAVVDAWDPGSGAVLDAWDPADAAVRFIGVRGTPRPPRGRTATPTPAVAATLTNRACARAGQTPPASRRCARGVRCAPQHQRRGRRTAARAPVSQSCAAWPRYGHGRPDHRSRRRADWQIRSTRARHRRLCCGL